MRLSKNLWQKMLRLWPIALSVTVTDCATKHVAEEHLFPHLPYDVVGNVLRFTLGYNPAGAMNISFGAWSRPILVLLTGITLAVLLRWYLRARVESTWSAVGCALILGGALGNLFSRLFSERGVVDFIDVGVGIHRFWTFNVADAGITIGALMVGLIMMRVPTQHERA